MRHRKTQVAAAVGAALLIAGTAVQAQTPAPVAPQQPLSVQLYGQVNRALMFVDNEVQSKWFHVDNQMSSTRFGILGTAAITPGLRAGARIETEIRSNRSNDISFATPASGSQSFTERWLDVFFEGAWGRINMGQGSGAADDASTIDLSGTSIVQGATLSDHGGNMPFTTAAGAAAGVVPVEVLDNLDFESRYDRFMYTTPVFGGFRAQVGLGQKAAGSAPISGGGTAAAGEVVEASVWYSGKLAGTLQAALGWSLVNTEGAPGVPGAAAQDRETMGGSVSWLSTFGLNLTAQYTQRDLDVPTGTATREAKHYFLKAGYKFGQHAISLAWERGEDQALAGDQADAYSLAYVWNPIAWAEIYAAYHIFQLDGNPLRAGGADINDMNIFVVGSRIRF